MSHLSCFKAYDIRGQVPDELDEKLAFRIGQAYAAHFKPQKMALAHDIRLSGPSLTTALCEGFLQAGVDVVHLGQCGTEEIYFAASHLNDVDGAIIVTASHNPAAYNGMKMVLKGAIPVSGSSGLREIEALAAAAHEVHGRNRGEANKLDNRPAYIDHLLSYIKAETLSPLKIVANPGNGGAGPIIAALAPHLPFQFIAIDDEPDGHFPNGVPNPLLPENRAATSEAVRLHGAQLGLAWDGDFDRCFFFDEAGNFIEGYYIVGLLAQAMLKKAPGAKIIHDPRLTWNTQELVRAAGGQPIMTKTGHAFIKERMRSEDAVYGGEMSAHHYFRDFSYCDSGMIPWLLIAELLCQQQVSISSLVAQAKESFPVSGEINNKVAEPDEIIAAVEERYLSECQSRDDIDGLSMSFDNWRFNIRKSNTEPVLRLNVESRGDVPLMEEKTAELLAMIKGG
ncbi:MAG: phosphomannomutase [Thermodesulfobacteriota bacterium]